MRKRPAAHVMSPAVADQESGANKSAKCSTDGQPGDDSAACILRSPHSTAVFDQLGAKLRRGGLVAFPTETVYGLGANGLDAQAVLGIFEAKGRPLSDPCILHVACAADARPLLQLSHAERAVFDLLTAECWPGPLSIVGRAQSVVPREVTASTDFVAVRCPAHPLAQRLLQAARVPLAAPSANRFGHISPTLAEHVMGDLAHVRGLRILDGGPCNVGIESTVMKLDLPSRLVILRKGGVTKEKLEAVIAAGVAQGVLHDSVAVEFPAPIPREVMANEQVPQQAPGMMLKHYAPSVHTVLLSTREGPPPNASTHDALLQGLPESARPGRSVLIDFGQRLKAIQHLFLRIFDLCGDECHVSNGLSSAEQACVHIFAVLREAESYALEHGVDLICIADFESKGLGGHAEALHDKIFRAASGRRVSICLEGTPHFVPADAVPSQ